MNIFLLGVNLIHFLIKKKKLKKEIKNITIFLGGSSYEKFNYKVAQRIKNYDGTRFILGGELDLKFKKIT